MQLTSLQGAWLDHKFSFRLSSRCHCWYAMAGVSLSTKPGKYALHLQGDAATSRSVTFTREVVIAAGRYPSTAIKVAPEYVEPPKEVEARIEHEQALKKQVFSETSPEPVWAGNFEAPASTEVSGVFGSARVLNGVKKNQHTGLDFHAAIGTPIHATNRGKVILARNLYFEGNCVVLDHGDGLATLYMHLSEFKVKEGDLVEKGQLLGLSGGTGRATGPHLHFAVRWQGTYLDPATLLKLTAP
jgi:murein DD-endopeptidase MepM/ murein hydrolase activator NlpD